MLNAFSHAVTAVFDVLLIPFGDHRTAGLMGISAATGVLLMFLFRATSNPEGIRATRDAFKAHILEMRIYQDDVVLILKGLGSALYANLRYLRVVLKPLLILGLVVASIFFQLDERYGRSALAPGDETLLTVTLRDGVDPMNAPISVAAPDGGVVVDAKPVRVPDRREINWRLKTVKSGVHPVSVTVYDTAYRFPIVAQHGNEPLGYERRAHSLSDPLLHPALPAIPRNSAVQSVRLRYPGASYPLVFGRTNWIVVFIVCSFLGAMVPKIVFRIQV